MGLKRLLEKKNARYLQSTLFCKDRPAWKRTPGSVVAGKRKMPSSSFCDDNGVYYDSDEL